jgi:hypothetical protein
MNEIRINKALSWAGHLCQIGCTLLIALALTVSPQEWMNTGLALTVLLGILAVGLSAASVSQKNYA